MATVKIQHQTLGQVTGLKETSVYQFFGIKYGLLSHGFASPELHEYPIQNEIHATKKGPTAVQPAGMCAMEQGIIQHSLPYDDLGTSSVDCLNLNVFAPEGRSTTLFPVIVFLHGGAFAIGSGSWPQYDLTKFVGLSIQLGQPVVAITLNYRVGVYGFLSSAELRKAGIPSNRGLLDQRVAFAWIARHVGGFGGDPNNITVAGESAGGVSGTHHLRAKAPQFRQLIAMSGNFVFMRPLPPSVAELAYETVIESLSLNSSEDRVHSLISTPPEEFLDKIPPSVLLMPTIDEDSSVCDVAISDFSGGKLPEILPGWTWCERILVGDCQFDGSIFAISFKNGPAGVAEKFTGIVQKTLQDYPDTAKSLLSNYKVDGTGNEQGRMFGVLRFATDICFYATSLVLAGAWTGRSFLYHFNQPNPWDGPFKGEATHVFDVAVLFQNYNEFLNDKQQQVALGMAKDFISFVYGNPGPFPLYSKEVGGAKIYHDAKVGGGEFLLSTDPKSYDRTNFISELSSKVPQDVLLSIWSTFLGSM